MTNEKAKLSDHPVIVIIFVIAAFMGIIASFPTIISFTTGKKDIPELLSTATQLVTVNSTIEQPSPSPTIEIAPTYTKNQPTVVIQPPVMSLGNVTVEKFGTKSLALTNTQVVVGTADRYQDLLNINNPPFTIFVIYGPVETQLSLWWGGWDVWENASTEHIANEIVSKIDEVIKTHSDYKTRGYRVIKCHEKIIDCDVILTFP